MRAFIEAIFGYPTNQSFSYPSTINSSTTCFFSTSCAPAAPFHIRNWEKQKG
jgi:hypothetical protein